MWVASWTMSKNDILDKKEKKKKRRRHTGLENSIPVRGLDTGSHTQYKNQRVIFISVNIRPTDK